MLKGFEKFFLFTALISLFFITGCENTKTKKRRRSRKQTQQCQNQYPPPGCSNCIIDCSDCFTQSCRTGTYTKK